jgi:hypothetical protein
MKSVFELHSRGFELDNQEQQMLEKACLKQKNAFFWPGFLHPGKCGS